MKSNALLRTSRDSFLTDFFEPRAKGVFKHHIDTTVQYIQDFMSRDYVHSGKSPDYLRHIQQLNQSSKYEPRSLQDTLGELKELFLDHTVAYHHPNYLSHLNCPIVLPAIVGDLIATSVNTAIETWDQNNSGTLIEQEMIDWATDRIGLSDKADGVFTSGGTQSNLMAMLLARDHFAYEKYRLNIKEDGADQRVQKFRILCSEKSHFSLQKSAALLGMGYNAVIPVPTDHEMKMDMDALRSLVESTIEKGEIPIAVVATMGTTDYGSFDPLSEIAWLAQKYGLWLHVDGAYGGCYAMTNTHKHLFKGIELIDSMTVDFHKSFFQPVSSSALLVNDKSSFKYVSHHADYLNPLESRNEDMPDLIEKSIQTTRRFDALKLWFTLKTIGEEKVINYLEDIHKLTKETYDRVQDDEMIEFIHKPTLSTLVFRYITPNVKDDRIHERVNKYIKHELYTSGELSVASTRHQSKLYLKFTLLDPNMSSDQLVSAFNKIKEKGRAYQYNN